MSVTSAVFKVHSILQKVVPQPWHLIPGKQLATKSQLYSKPKFKFFRILSRFLSFGFCFPFFIYRLCWLLFYWKWYKIYNVDQAVIYGMFLCCFIVFLGIFQLQCWYKTEIIYILNQLYQLCLLFKYLSKPEFSDIINKNVKVRNYAMELIIYYISMVFVLLTVCWSAFPLVVSFCPLQLIFGDNCFVTVIEIFYFSIIMTFHLFSFLSAMLLIVTVFDSLSFCSSKMFDPADCSVRNLSKYCRNFRCIEIILRIFSIALGPLLIRLIFVGIIIASCSGSMTIRWYGKVNIFIYILTPLETILCFTLAILLTYLFNIPHKNSKKFFKFWMLHLRKNEDKKTIRALMPIGLKLGPYGLATSKLGIRICDDMIQNMIDLILLDVS